MRTGVVIVFALLTSCVSTRTWGKEEILEKETAEQTSSSSLRRNILSMVISYAVSCAPNGPWEINGASHACKRRLQESRYVGHAFRSDAKNVTTVEKPVLSQFNSLQRGLQNRYVRRQAPDKACLSKDSVKAAGHTVTEAPARGQVTLGNKNVALLRSRRNVQGDMYHMSLLDVADEAAADMQANAVRRQGVDSSLLRYAGLALSPDSETGTIYNVDLPPSLTGISSQAMRIVPGSLQQVGLIFNEFTIPMGAVFSPAGDYVVLVYRRITSFTVYALPSEYKFGGPVVGIMSSSTNSTTIDPSLPAGSVSLPANFYINISLPVYSAQLNGDMLCAFFALNGSIILGSLASSPNNCLSSSLGDFALVVKSSATLTADQNGSPSSTSTNSVGRRSSSSSHAKASTSWKPIVLGACLAIGGLAFLVAVGLISRNLKGNFSHFLATRHYSGNDEALQDSLVGGSMAPSAPVMRTKPALEIDVARFSH